MRFTIYQESRIGGRKSNQDRIAYCYSRNALLMVVADGMGGHLHGEVAAQIAVQYITESFQREARPALDNPVLFLSRTLTNAHNAILDYAFDRGLPEAPRTTCVACVIQDSVGHWAHAGDSRLYLIRRSRSLAQTRDHSRVQMMVEQGLINERDAAAHPSRNRVFSCLGGVHSPQIDFSRPTPLQAGDLIGLCTDGVWSALGNDELIEHLAAGDVAKAVPQLLDEAEARAGGGCDNISLIAIRWEESFAGETLGSVETGTMPLDSFTTELRQFGETQAAGQVTSLSDEDIEQAIDEIRNAIQKYSK